MEGELVQPTIGSRTSVCLNLKSELGTQLHVLQQLLHQSGAKVHSFLDSVLDQEKEKSIQRSLSI